MTNYSIYDDLDCILVLLNLSTDYISGDEELVEAHKNLKTLYSDASKSIDNAERLHEKLKSGYLVLEARLSRYLLSLIHI